MKLRIIAAAIALSLAACQTPGVNVPITPPTCHVELAYVDKEWRFVSHCENENTGPVLSPAPG